MYKNIYRDKKVLVTGHTGFKGSWMALWLSTLGAKITGYSLLPPTEPNHFNLLDIDIVSIIGDVNDEQRLKQVFKAQKPEIVFHLAAQPIVRLSYREPAATFATNVMGTINVLEAARQCDCVRAIVNITSDKCYENREWPWGYREIDPLGGHDPYSASKGCAEIITACWRNSFFDPKNRGGLKNTLLASARAGNVIGGGDWAVDRLVPDMMRSVSLKEKLKIRNPMATRPWQHVLEPLSGYLLLGQRLLEGRMDFAEAWNFGPSEEGNATVAEIVAQARQIWQEIDYEIKESQENLHEAGMLGLDCSKARTKLQWSPVWDRKVAVEKTVQWYRNFHESGHVHTMTDLQAYISDAQEKHFLWAEE